VLRGVDPPRIVVFIDEIEKAFAGTGTDLSGVKTETTGTILTYMQDREADGMVFVGPADAVTFCILSLCS
jgi:SpoVK/Ycf46/Vps4 family AAA+-type ATPase